MGNFSSFRVGAGGVGDPAGPPKTAVVMDKLGPYLLNSIVTGDARDLAKGIPDGSVDLIFTDPVYQNIDDYRWLAETAARILKDEGMLFALAGHAFLPDIFVAVDGLIKFHWLIAYHHPQKNAAMFQKRLWVTWKPCLTFSKTGAGSGKFILDSYTGTKSQMEYSKLFHKWGQGEDFFTYYIGQLANDAYVILDPFCGGGTVPAVCKMLGRNYLGFEIDADTAEDARQRVAQTQPPLFTLPVVEQATLAI